MESTVHAHTVPCAARCGRRLTWRLIAGDGTDAPELYLVNAGCSYAAGHLCAECHSAVGKYIAQNLTKEG